MFHGEVFFIAFDISEARFVAASCVLYCSIELNLHVFDLSRSNSPSLVIHLVPLVLLSLCMVSSELWDPRLPEASLAVSPSASQALLWLLSQLKRLIFSLILLSGVVTLLADGWVTWRRSGACSLTSGVAVFDLLPFTFSGWVISRAMIWLSVTVMTVSWVSQGHDEIGNRE